MRSVLSLLHLAPLGLPRQARQEPYACATGGMGKLTVRDRS